MENYYDNFKVNMEKKLFWFVGFEFICWIEILRMVLVFRIEWGWLVGGGKCLD